MTPRDASDQVVIESDLLELLEAEYPRFSSVEMLRRRRMVEDLMSRRSVDHLVIYAAAGRGGALSWLSQWLVTHEALLVVSPDSRDALFVQYFNHVPLARTLASEATVNWGGPSTIEAGIDELARRGAGRGRIGVLGPLPLGAARALEARYGPVLDLNGDYASLRLVKSPEELTWFRLGARLADLSIEALGDQLRPGVSERDLVSIVESAYHSYGGVNGIHYFAVNPMSAPTYCTPRQHPSTRLVRRGDVVTTEITANFFDYGAQVLRTFSVGERLSPLFQDLHDVADAAYQAIVARLSPGTHASELVEAASVIEDAGFTTLDDLVHGYGGGYLPPVLGSASRPNERVPDMVLVEGMMLVVQPNVVTTDFRAGVQTGECVLVTREGPRRLHSCAQGALRVG